MSDSVERLNAALEGRYAIERELGEGRDFLLNQRQRQHLLHKLR